MPKYTIPYGTSSLSFTLPEEANVEVVLPHSVPPLSQPRQAVEKALDQIPWKDLKDLRNAAISINDKTRPVPHHHLLPPLLEKCNQIGIPTKKITLIIANGAHPPMTEDEFSQVVPKDILSRYQVVSHDCDDSHNLVYLGETQRGTPVWVNRTYAEADFRIVVGNIEPHHFMGFSGGAKGAAIGLVGRETINANHAMMTDPQSQLGEYRANPARQDVEEIGEIIRVHLTLNSILNDEKEIVHVVVGSPQEVMTKGIPWVRDIYQVEVTDPFDLLILSPGGHPKDINLYQSQKALAHASSVIRKKGVILMAAACPEGCGDDTFESWMEDTSSLEAILDRFQNQGFLLGAHKAYLFSRDASRVHFHLISEMKAEKIKRLHLNPAEDLNSALQTLFPTLPSKARIGIIPYGNSTIPVLEKKETL